MVLTGLHGHIGAMSVSHRTIGLTRPSLSFISLVFLLAILWLAGGASRADAAGQVIVRGTSMIAIFLLILFADRPPPSRSKVVPFFLLTSLGLVLLQLVPLPPGIWRALPGRDVFLPAAIGGEQPWRPWAIVPGGALNAAVSLIVPGAAFMLLTTLRPIERMWLPGVTLGLITASMLLGLLQLSGAGFDNPLINDTPGQISGSFANRNHFALFLAFGCLLAPVWAFLGGRSPQWRGPVALGLVVLFALTILASGSRAGMLLGMIAAAAGVIITRKYIKKAFGRYPRWVLPALAVALVIVFLSLGLATVMAGRALSIDRVFANDPGQDMRARALPIVLAMVREYFPAGAGFGGFDPLFRMREPFELLKLTYFNHAHNDWLEVVLDAGILGLLLLISAVVWWVVASVRRWRVFPQDKDLLPIAGSVMLLLVFVASIVDYPARTPMMMMMIVMAAMWLSGDTGEATTIRK